MAVSVWVWLRGEFLLESFLPLNFSASSSSTSRSDESSRRSTAVDGAHALIDVCQARNWDRLSVLEWSNIVDEIGLDNALSEAVYRNASGEEAHATLSCLALHILLAGLERFSYEADEATSIRGDVVTAMVQQQMDDFISVLCRCALGCSQAVLKKDRIRFNNQQLKELSTSIDLLFEGMTEDDEADKRHDQIVKVSEIMQDIWFKDNEISLRKLTANMRKCLVQDPFQIDDLSVDTPSCSSRRVTSLTSTRRKVTVAGWQRFQLLTKLDNSDVSTLAANDFYIQPVPMVNSDNNVKDLLQKLPPFYRGQWENTMAEMREPSDDRVSILPLKKSDLIYLRGKIASER
nr:Protein C54G6.2 [Haemonchus contortus]